jgi:hypothetical protein
MKQQEFNYYMHDGPSAFRFELAGSLNDEGTRELRQAWRTASPVIGDRKLIVDMTFVTSVEGEGRRLLAQWYSGGAQIVARSKRSQQLAQAIVGAPLPEVAASDMRAGRTWSPFHAWLGAPKLRVALLLAALLLPAQSHAADLKSETVAAWDDYIQTVNAALIERARPGGHFLWADEESNRMTRVFNGEIVVAPAPGPNPRKVPGGLIHHWIAAAFLPNVKIDDVLEVTEDYDRYQEFYRPLVIASRGGLGDAFSMRMMNKAFLLKTMFDADFKPSDMRVDEGRFYSFTKSTRMQEIENFGEPGERRLPEGKGAGYIWKLFSTVRLEKRSGGVYMEVEAIALSRDVPGAFRMVVDPIVRRVSRNSMLISIRQTEEAVLRNSAAAAKPASSSVSAEQLRRTSSAPVNKNATFAGFK